MNRNQLLKQTFHTVPPWAGIDRTILVGLRGSDAHGTKLKDKDPNDIDDIDVFTLIVHPVHFYLGLDGYRNKREHWDSAGQVLDVLVYDIRKFMDLAASCNPNVINWLFNRPEDYLNITPSGQLLIDNRDMFLSKEIFKRLSGYAYAQMKRMESNQAYEGYMGAKRKGLVDKFGYDVKNAAHCVRLLYMSMEIANTNTFSTYRPDFERELIMDIKSGVFTLDAIINLIKKLTEKVNDSEKNSRLPEKNDRDKISELLEHIIQNFNRNTPCEVDYYPPL